MDTPDEIRENKWRQHNGQELEQPRNCGLCGIEFEKSEMACDVDACECYCEECIKNGEVERYLIRCEYNQEMIDKIINQIK